MSLTLEELLATRGRVPRETTFGAPWEARAFALATVLADRGAFVWEAFRERLIAAIAAADAAAASGRTATGYYECWLAALEDVLQTGNLVNAIELDQRAAQIAANPPKPTKALSAGPIKVA